MFVSAVASDAHGQETDVHYQALSDAHFNWRFLFDIGQPTRHTKLNVQIWDTRSLGPNEALAECSLQLATLFENVNRTKEMHEIPRQWYTCFLPGLNPCSQRHAADV